MGDLASTFRDLRRSVRVLRWMLAAQLVLTTINAALVFGLFRR